MAIDRLPSVLAPLGAEIRSQLERAPDVGDLLLACACVPHTSAYRALEKVGIDIDQLWGEIEHARGREQTDRDALATRIREVAAAKELAIEERDSPTPRNCATRSASCASKHGLIGVRSSRRSVSCASASGWSLQAHPERPPDRRTRHPERGITDPDGPRSETFP